MSFTTILLLLLGITLVVAGSNYLVDGAADIARRSGLSEFVIGLTIVGIGTSAPEMVVSFISAFQGNSDMSVGNIIGSNIFNTCLILGLTSIILPLKYTADNIRRDIPMYIFVSILLIMMGMNRSLFHFGTNTLSRIDGAMMLAIFAAYMYSSFKHSSPSQDEESTEPRFKKPIIPALMTVGGMVALIIGGHLFVDNATVIARHFGWSDKLIGITILALGTSLPELATCVVAALKKQGQLALGNIIGSNISNVLLILGGAALIHPLEFLSISFVDLGFLLISSLFLLISYFTIGRKQLDRSEGAMLLVMAAGYFYILFTAL